MSIWKGAREVGQGPKIQLKKKENKRKVHRSKLGLRFRWQEGQEEGLKEKTLISFL